MKIAMLNGKIKIERLRNTLDEFEINELEVKLNPEIEILEEREKPAIKNIKNIRTRKIET